MYIQFFIGDKLIATVMVDKDTIEDPTRLAQKKNELEEEFKELIEKSRIKPTFYLEVSSSLHRKKGKYKLPI